jgi:hypothetical protein
MVPSVGRQIRVGSSGLIVTRRTKESQYILVESILDPAPSTPYIIHLTCAAASPMSLGGRVSLVTSSIVLKLRAINYSDHFRRNAVKLVFQAHMLGGARKGFFARLTVRHERAARYNIATMKDQSHWPFLRCRCPGEVEPRLSTESVGANRVLTLSVMRWI